MLWKDSEFIFSHFGTMGIKENKGCLREESVPTIGSDIVLACLFFGLNTCVSLPNQQNKFHNSTGWWHSHANRTQVHLKCIIFR